MASKRIWVSWLGDYYMDVLAVEAAIKGRTQAAEAASLLCSILQQREEKRRQMVQYLADKNQIPYEEMWRRLANGTYKTDDIEIDTEESEV